MVILDASNDEDPAPLRVRRRRPPATDGAGCNTIAVKDEQPSNDDGDYTAEIYRMLGMS